MCLCWLGICPLPFSLYRVNKALAQGRPVAIAVTVGPQVVGVVFQSVHEDVVHVVEGDGQVRATLGTLQGTRDTQTQEYLRGVICTVFRPN